MFVKPFRQSQITEIGNNVRDFFFPICKLFFLDDFLISYFRLKYNYCLKCYVVILVVK